MRHFLILFDEIPIDKASVKSGNNSQEVIIAARCVNVGLFISGNLRRDVVISLAQGSPEDLKIISFPGASLKRVSPDERSISFFLMKGSLIAEEMPTESCEVMDNGIEVRRTSFAHFLDSLSPSSIYLSTEGGKLALREIDEDSLLVYRQGRGFGFLQIDSKWKYSDVPHFPHPERFILDINMRMDMKKAS